MSYMALYRKFRPVTFEDVKGQDHIVTTLKNQIMSDRVGHAYLFCGTRGTGKTTIAKILARAVNCEQPVNGNPCGECPSCKAIAAGASMNVIEIDAASNNGVDNIRQIVEEVSYSPAEGKKKVYIIDEVHMLSVGAFNALLKTLEEPPSYVIFILATTESQKIPITILSRCQRYDFKRISNETIVARLQDLMNREGYSVEQRALAYIAKAGDGSMRDSLSLLDQCLAFHYGETLTYDNVLDVLGAVDTEVFSRLLRGIMDGNVTDCIALIDEIMIQGRELVQFVTDFVWYLRNLMLANTSESVEGIIDMSSDNLRRLTEEAGMLDADTIMRYIRVFAELLDRMKKAVSKRILLEVEVVRLCQPPMHQADAGIEERLRDLERRMEQGFVPAGGTVMQQVTVQPSAPFVRKELDRAVPEDVQQLVRQWRQLQEEFGFPLKAYLKDARLSLAGDNRLMIVVPEGLCYDGVSTPDKKEEIENVLSQAIGKNISVEIQKISVTENFERSYVDLTQVIHMEIETDNSEADEF